MLHMFKKVEEKMEDLSETSRNEKYNIWNVKYTGKIHSILELSELSNYWWKLSKITHRKKKRLRIIELGADSLTYM